MDTLAFGYALGAIPCARDFHPLDCAHAWHTKMKGPKLTLRTFLLFRCAPASLVTHRLDRVELGRTSGGEEAEHHAREGRHGEGEQIDARAEDEGTPM